MLPDLRTREGFDSLKESGYFDAFDNPRQYKMQAEIVETAIKNVSCLTNERELVADTAFLVFESLMAPPPGTEFFQRFPKEEVGQFCQLTVESRVGGSPIPIVSPVCPDYQGHYRLSNGVGKTAEKVLVNLAKVKAVFEKRNFLVSIMMQVADVEAYEPLILQASGETTASFLQKTRGSIVAIQERIEQMGLSNLISCGSMLESFTVNNLDYFKLKELNSREIINHGGRKVARATEALIEERRRLGDFDRIDGEQHKPLAADELANYATYGDLVNGKAMILSPDSHSSMAAYNFLRGDAKKFNPTIFVK